MFAIICVVHGQQPTSHPSRPAQLIYRHFQKFTFTGSVQYFTPPSGVNIIYIEAYGGSGGVRGGGGCGGGGAKVSATLQVTPLFQLAVNIGGKGTDTSASAQIYAGGFNGG